ncbi:hypothetical protein HY250_01125 [Candidatus Azambacteria bacterium]|nr:hypothetical protein [Candidatus Azambacteria bacterium]MBI3684989.1 hypothetical protein [Candidatus Azambacteria bacterium]
MDEYKKIISELVKRQMEIMGPSAALSIARKTPSVKIADNGQVTDISGDQKTALELVANSYIAFSGEISRIILKSVLGRLQS